ncbi:Protein kinase domain-containing protein [Psidium guajava]|nr:Protein kinase domain-containing protein [Psidium guajava]
MSPSIASHCLPSAFCKPPVAGLYPLVAGLYLLVVIRQSFICQLLIA